MREHTTARSGLTHQALYTKISSILVTCRQNMANSLQDQLQKNGLIDAKKAKAVKKNKRKVENARRKSGQTHVDEAKQLIQQANTEKQIKDKQLNDQKNQKVQRKAIAAQIKQLIEMNMISASGEEPFSFSDGKYIKRIYVTRDQQDRLSRGIFSIVKLGDKYVIVPTPVADRIAERDPTRIIFKADKSLDLVDKDDPYADYKIPDDLTW